MEVLIKIALISDTHIGITSPGRIKEMLNKLKRDREGFDIIVHAGDYNGGINGANSVLETVSLIRDMFPDKPYLTTIGNHDFWCATSEHEEPNISDFMINYDNIINIFKDNNVWFLDEDGIWHDDKWPDVDIIGVSGWYQHPNPPTNDKHWITKNIEGNTNAYLLKRSERLLDKHLKDYNKEPYKSLIFVSHFPVVNLGQDYKGAFDEFCWSETIKKFMTDKYNVTKFLNGHSHQRHQGPVRHESGSDYYSPNYLIIHL